jgi:hypothetical protein
MGGTVAPSAPNEEHAAGTQLLRAVVPLLNQYVDQEAAEECLEVLQIALGRQGYLPAQLTDLVTSAAPPANCGAGGCEGPCGPCGPSDHSYLCPAPAVCEPIQEGLGLPWRWDTENLNLVTRDGETVIVSLRILGGTVDVSGPDQMEAAQAIATALNAYYRANPAPA